MREDGNARKGWLEPTKEETTETITLTGVCNGLPYNPFLVDRQTLWICDSCGDGKAL